MMLAMTLVNAEKCCHLVVSEHKVSAGCYFFIL